MTGAVAAMLRRVGKIATRVVPAAAVARLGLPAFGAVVFLSVLLLAAACWVIGSRDRTEHVSRMLLAWGVPVVRAEKSTDMADLR